jgi:1-phosphofructokinase family hexose kinase
LLSNMEKPPKILCVSANPAIDRRILLPALRLAEVNRATSVNPGAGGKAAHVAFAARSLGADVTWMAFLGGPEGDACAQGIKSHGITSIRISIGERTRTNLELCESENGAVTEILEPGPTISSDEAADFLAKFENKVRDFTAVVISGSLPRGLNPDFYVELIAIAKRAGSRVLFDSSGPSLAKSLKAGPDVIKPNRQEVSAILDRKINNTDEALSAANELRSLGAGIAIVSLGEQGAVVATSAGAMLGTPPDVSVKSAVGSGDAFLAGWTVAELQGKDAADCLRVAIACGAANCSAESPGEIDPSIVRELISRVRIESF